MLPNLKYFDQTPDLKVSPESLFHLLERSFTSFDSLLKELNCSLEDLDETLNAPETSNLLKLKMKVSALQVQLIACRAAPHCTARLVSLTNETEKPDVGRRSATTLLHLAGISTQIAVQEPAPPPVPPPKLPDPNEKPVVEMSPEEATSTMAVMLFARKLQRDHGLDFSKVPRSDWATIAEALRPFVPPIPPPESS